MDKFIGAKIIRAEEMDECTFLEKFKKVDAGGRETRPGYHVRYPDGYDSWSPKDVFETTYRKIADEELELLTDGDSEAAG